MTLGDLVDVHRAKLDIVQQAADEIKRLKLLVLDYAVLCGELSKGLPKDDPCWDMILDLAAQEKPE